MAGCITAIYRQSGFPFPEESNSRRSTPPRAKVTFFSSPTESSLVSEAGARVVETSEYPRLRESALLATQSGPLLVHGGKIHPAFNATSENRLIRNGVGVPSRDVAVFAISEAPVNFHEFAVMFRDML